MATGGEDEGYAGGGEPIGHRPDRLPILHPHIDDGEIETALFDLLQGVLDAVHGTGDAMAKRVEEVFEHHGDEGLVFDDQY